MLGWRREEEEPGKEDLHNFQVPRILKFGQANWNKNDMEESRNLSPCLDLIPGGQCLGLKLFYIICLASYLSRCHRTNARKWAEGTSSHNNSAAKRKHTGTRDQSGNGIQLKVGNWMDLQFMYQLKRYSEWCQTPQQEQKQAAIGWRSLCGQQRKVRQHSASPC